jgi:uncharacterized protein
LLQAIAASDAPEAGQLILDEYGSWTPAAQKSGIRILVMRPEWTGALLDAISEGKLRGSDLTLDQRQALSSHPVRRVAARARRILSDSGGLPSPDREQVLAELMPLTEQVGDAERGKKIYKEQCAKCHVHSGEGTRIGPDLDRHGRAFESRTADAHHRSQSRRGREFSALYGRDRGRTSPPGTTGLGIKTSLELYDTEGKQQLLLREDVEQIVASSKSLMPDGFEKQITEDGMRDLLEFLTQRGKFLPLPWPRPRRLLAPAECFTTRSHVVSDWCSTTGNRKHFGTCRLSWSILRVSKFPT